MLSFVGLSGLQPSVRSSKTGFLDSVWDDDAAPESAADASSSGAAGGGTSASELRRATPHLVSLSDDSLLGGALAFCLRDGATRVCSAGATAGGNTPATSERVARLSGTWRCLPPGSRPPAAWPTHAPAA